MKLMTLSGFALLLFLITSSFSEEKYELQRYSPELLKKAESGDPKAQLQLAGCYNEGRGIKKDKTQALGWIEKAANQNYPKAQAALGQCYLDGEIVQKNEKEAFRWYKQAAENGLAEGQYNIGCSYYNGIGVTKNTTEAFKWVNMAAEQGMPDAQYILGGLYERGEACEANKDEAVKWYARAASQGDVDAGKALDRLKKGGAPAAAEKNYSVEILKKAEAGDPAAQYFVGMCYLFGVYGKPIDYDTGYKLIQSSADSGNKNGKAALGWCYFLGAGVKQDDKKAFEIFQENAKEGTANAEAGLGFCYMLGRGVSQNDKEAFVWTKKAAEHGESKAQWNLGVLYMEGKGVPKNTNEGLIWIEKGAVHASASDQRKLGYDYEYSSEVFPQNLERAAYWYQQAADKGNCCGLYSLGLCYVDGKGVQQSYEKGFNLLKEARSQNCEYAICYLRENYYGPELAGKASAGDSQAQLKYGRCFLDGLGVEKNPEEGFKWVKKSAEEGNKYALNVIGILYEKGVGTDKNAAMAVANFKKASEKGNVSAQTRLGYIYRKGELTTKDMKESVKYLNLAAKAGEPLAQNDLAWIYATSANADLRNGEQAVLWATKAIASAKTPEPFLYGTLAAAYAENGQFQKAIDAQVKAISMLKPESKNEDFIAPLKSYREQKAWRDYQ
jgi:TPR repeat protein